MSTTVTVIDQAGGTIIVETERDVAIQIGVTTDIKVGGRPVEEAIATQALQIRTPEPEHQTLKVTDKPEAGPEKELPQKSKLQELRDKGQSPAQVFAREDAQKPQDAPKHEKSDESPETSSELKLEGPAPRKKAVKTCAKPGCGKQFEGANRQMYCDEHKTQPTAKKKIQAADADGQPTANSPLPEGMWWCVHHKSQQPHRSPDCPLIEDEPEKPATREEATAFTDPWDCGRCRIDGKICRFHRSMEASGHKPPKF